MLKAIKLIDLNLFIKESQIISERILDKAMKERKISLAKKVQKSFDVPLEQAAKMLFYPNYAINVKLCLNAYKESNKVYLAKKPSFFKCLFRKFEKARIVISQGKTSIDNKILDDTSLKEIWLIL